MSQVHTDCRWGVLVCTARRVHRIVRQGLRNQDAIDHCLADDGSPPVVLAVADGHGSAKSFRSDVGRGVCREDRGRGVPESSSTACRGPNLPP